MTTSKTLVIARHDEDPAWLERVPTDWYPRVFDKGATKISWSECLDNSGRESGTYLYWIINNYRHLPNEACMAQGNPFDHDPDFINNLCRDHVRWYGEIFKSPSSGDPHMTDANLGDYCRVLGLQPQEDYWFVMGAQYRLTKEQILSRPLAFYECLLALTKIDERMPYRLERIWPLVWNIKLV